MKFINLDAFKSVDRVTLGGESYEIYGRPVKDYLESDIDAILSECKTVKEKFSVLVEFAMAHSNIPRKVLVKQDMGVLNAILKVINGVDIEAELQAEAEAQAEGEDQGNA